MNTPKLAVFCYFFPPLNEVGGRRWTKFAKQLTEKGWEVTVFTGDIEKYPDLHKNKSWEKELTGINEIIQVKSNYPILLNVGPKTLFQKVLYRLFRKKIRRKTKGNIYDPSQLWNNCMIDQIETVIKKKGIDKIVVSGAPFAYMYHAIEIKKRNPNIRLYADFRDLWVDSKLGYGEYLKKYQGESVYLEERNRQEAVLKEFKQIWTVSSDISNIFKNKYKVSESKLKLLPNGFDPSDGMFTSVNQSSYSGSFRFLYFGTINCGRSYYMKFIDALKQLSSLNSELFNACSFTFIGNTNTQFSNDLKSSGLPNIIQLERKALAEIQEMIMDYDFLLYFKMENDLENSFATKFFDYLRLRLPIVILSPEGDVTKYIRETKCGFVLNDQDVNASLLKLLKDYQTGKFIFNNNENHDRFNLNLISDLLIRYLQES